MMKPQIISIVVLTILVSANLLFAQAQQQPCFEVKHFDFFGLKEDLKINWSNEELDKLIELEKAQSEISTNFLIAPLVFQLKDFHPNCKKKNDEGHYNKLITLYFKIRQKDFSLLKDKTVSEQLLFIREDFYSQLQDEKLLPYMRYTMDDGPLYGEIPKSVPKSDSSGFIVTNFGKLTIIESDNQVFLVAIDQENKIMWSRVMKGTNPDRFLKNLRYDKEAYEKTSLATIIHLQSEGERLTLYLKPDGKFMYYYHSW